MYPKLVAKSSEIITKIFNHPFNEELCTGRLASPIFRRFLEQDTAYLATYAKALKIFSTRLTDPKQQEQYALLSKKILESELKLHNRYLNNTLRYPFFKPIYPKIPIVQNYSDYLLYMARCDSIPNAIASFLPCFSIYAELGQWMNYGPHPQAENPYRKWIASYSSPWFLEARAAMIDFSNQFEATEDACKAFRRSAFYEYYFIDKIYHPKEYNIAPYDILKPSKDLDIETHGIPKTLS